MLLTNNNREVPCEISIGGQEKDNVNQYVIQ